MAGKSPAIADSKPAPAPRTTAGRRSFWLPSVVMAIGVHAAAFVVFGVASGHHEPHRAPLRGVGWLGERADEAIEVRDPKPIFLPTGWNAATRETNEADNRGPGEIFGFEERARIVEVGTSPAGLVLLPEGVRTAGEAIRKFTRPYFLALGQEDPAVQRLPSRAALVEILVATSGEVVFRWELTLAMATDAGGDASRWPFWAAFEMLLAVEPTGSLGPPLVTAPGSGADEVDRFFRSTLRHLLRPDLVLPAGYYRVVIGP